MNWNIYTHTPPLLSLYNVQHPLDSCSAITCAIKMLFVFAIDIFYCCKTGDKKTKLIFSICICNACLCTMNLYNVTARQKDRPLVLQGPGWHNVFWRQIWKIIFMYRMRRISIIRITGLLIHAEILGFVFDFCPFRMCFIFYLWSSPQTFPVILAFLHIFAGFKQFLFQKILNTTQSCICIQDLSKTLHHQTCGTGLTC